MNKIFKKKPFIYLMLFTLFSNFCFPLSSVEAVKATQKKTSIESFYQKERAKLAKEDFQKLSQAKLAVDPEQVTDSTKQAGKDPEEIIRVIVQLKEKTASQKLSAKAQRSLSTVKTEEQKVIDQQEKTQEKVKAITGEKIIREFGYLVNGFSTQVKRKDLPKLRKLSNVKSVTEVKANYPTMTSALDMGQIKAVRQTYNYKGENTLISIIDTGIDYEHKDMRITTNQLKLTREAAEEKATELGYGKILTDKVPFGYNYADRNNQVIDKTSSMHGMHVAGIAAANGNPEEVKQNKAIQGVAPEAQLLAMKVFSNNPKISGAYDDDIIAAIEDSVKLHADIINMSLGSEAGFTDPNDPEQIAIKNASKAGTLCVISAGNSQTSTSTDGKPSNPLGTTDTAILGSPGIAPEALTVASAENSSVTTPLLTSYKNDQKLTDLKFTAVDDKTLPALESPHELVAIPNVGNKEDFTGLNVKGKIALIARGSITFDAKVENAKAAGAVGVFIYNTDNSTLSMAVTDNKLPVLSIGHDDGITLKNQIAAGAKFTFLNEGAVAVAPNGKATMMSDFTSWGPTPDLNFKPEITAPGGHIYSTINNNSYGTKSGTSMASPYTAGAEALIYQSIQAKKLNLTGTALIQFAKQSLMNTAKPVSENGKLVSPRRQGSGLLQVKDALDNEVALTDGNGNAAVALKQISGSTTFNLQLTNNGSKAITYKVENGDVLTEQTQDNVISSAKITGASLDVANKTVTLQPNETKTVQVALNLPAQFKKQAFVEGFITFTSQTAGKPSLSIPYMGYYGDFAQEPIVDAPIYDEENSLLNESALLTYYGDDADYLGSQQKVVDPEKIAISPNGDDQGDIAVPYLLFLRNSQETTFSITDKSGKVLRKVYKEDLIRKGSYDSSKGAFSQNLIINAAWDGTLYNSETGKYEPVPDGQYYYQVASKSFFSTTDQTIKFPIKVDTKAPTFENVTLEKQEDGTYLLKWDATDELSGLNLDLAAIQINGKNPRTFIPNRFTKDQKHFEMPIDVKDNSTNKVELLMSDMAGNTKTTTETVTAGTSDSLSFFDLKDNMKITSKNNYYDVDKQVYTIEGSLLDSSLSLKINGTAVETKNHLFAYELKVKDGAMEIPISLTDKDGETVVDQTYHVTVDTTGPTITITKPTPSEKTIQVSEKTLHIEGQVDRSDVISMSIKDNEQGTNITSSLQDDGTFAYDLKLFAGENQIRITAIDKNGNETVWTQKVLCHAIDDLIQFTNLQPIMTFNKESLEKEGSYTIKGFVKQPIDTFYIQDQPVQIKDDLTFEQTISLKQGTNIIQVLAKNQDTVIQDYCYRLVYDSKAPVISLEQPIAKSNGNVYVKKEEVQVKGTVADNLNTNTTKLFVNGDILPIPTTQDKTATFEKIVPLTAAKSILELKAVDEVYNTVVMNIPVIIDQQKPEKPVVTSSTTEPIKAGEAVTLTAKPDPKDDDVEKIEYSLDGKEYYPYTEEIQITENKTVYFRATDFAGNVSEIAPYKVDNIYPSITDYPIIELSETGYTNKPVTVTISNSAEKNTRKQLRAAATEPRVKIAYSFDGKTFEPYTEPISVNKVTFIYAKLYDAAGNETPVVVSDQPVLSDSTKPVIISTNVTEGGTYAPGFVPEFTSEKTLPTLKEIDLENYRKVNLKKNLDGKAYDSAPITAIGKHTLTVSGVDLFGNTSEATVNFTIEDPKTASDNSKKDPVSADPKNSNGNNSGSSSTSKVSDPISLAKSKHAYQGKVRRSNKDPLVQTNERNELKFAFLGAGLIILSLLSWYVYKKKTTRLDH